MPRRFLSDAEVTRYLVGTDAILASNDQPHCQHPLVHTKRRVLKDAGDLNGELLFTALAEPETASADVGVLFGLAARALDALRPTQLGSELVSTVDIGEVENSLLQALG